MGSIRVQETRSEWSGHTVRVVRRHGPSGPGPSGPRAEMSAIHISDFVWFQRSCGSMKSVSSFSSIDIYIFFVFSFLFSSVSVRYVFFEFFFTLKGKWGKCNLSFSLPPPPLRAYSGSVNVLPRSLTPTPYFSQ